MKFVRKVRFSLSFLPLFLLLLLPLPTRHSSLQAEVGSDETCFSCHERKIKGWLAGSAHRGIECRSCHTDARAEHPTRLKPVQCRNCHERVTEAFRQSDHGRALISYTGCPCQEICRKCHEASGHQILPRSNPKSRVYRGNIAATCASCHEKKDIVKHYRTKLHPFKSYEQTVHGQRFRQGNMKAATCSDCHGSHSNQFRINPRSRVALQNIGRTCGKCHRTEYEEYEKGVHARALHHGMSEAPICITCHGEHDIKAITNADSRANRSSISRRCEDCHASEQIVTKFGLPEDRISSYRTSFHGTMSRYGNLEVARCASCHGAHAVLPSTDPNSPVHPSRLADTCGKCHPGAGSNITAGRVHLNPRLAGSGPVFWIRRVYIIAIIVIIGFMLLHNILDFAKKLRIHYQRTIDEAVAERLNVLERTQHILLVISFVGLAWTGFAIAYPESVFAYPFCLWAGGQELRWWLHRIFAAIMIMVSLLHVYYALFTSKGRKELRGFMPRIQDFRDLFAMIAYNLGLREEKPVFGWINYVEKAEYLALVWGTVIMVVTGAILMLHRFTLAYFPLIVINISTIVHLYEAILASLAILVWHLYYVLYDPDEYPMNWTWRTGKLPGHHSHRIGSAKKEE